MFRFYALFLTFLTAFSLKAEIIINGLDISNYPEVKGTFYYYNNTSFPIYNLSNGQLAVFDNGREANVKSFNVPQAQFIDKVSSGIVLDLAITDNKNFDKFDIAKLFAGELISLYPETGGEVSLMSIDKIPYLNCPFTNDKDRLNFALDLIKSKSTSDIENGFNAVPGGIIDVIKNGTHDKSVIFISDGNKQIETASIILLAQSAGIKINCVTADEFANPALKQIAAETGGIVIENLDTLNYKKYAKILVSSIYGYKPIEMVWDNFLDCEEIHNVEFVIDSRNDTCRYELAVPDTNKPALRIDPAYLKFGAVIPGSTKELELYLTAENADVNVSSMTIAGVDFSITSGYTPGQNIFIPKNESHTIKVKYSPTDSNIVFAVLTIQSDACFGKEVCISGGFPNRPPKNKTINLTHPNSGEILVAGDTCNIQWHGMLPTDVIQLEYSVDNGTVWDTLAQDIMGLEYLWNVPIRTGTMQDGRSTLSDNCSARIIQLWPNNVGQTLDFPHKYWVLSANFSKSDGTYIVTTSNDRSMKIWNSYTGAILSDFKREGTYAYPIWANFNDAEDKVVVTYSDGVIIIYDRNANQPVLTINAHDGDAVCANFNHAGDRIVSVGYDEKINIWNANDGKLMITFDNSTKVWSCEFMKDDNRVIYCDNKGRAKVFNTSTREIEKEFHNEDYNLKVNNVAINSDETMIATSQQDGNACVWDFATGERKFKVSHGEYTLLNFVEFGLDPITNQELIITSSTDYTARTWKASNGDSIAVLREHNNSVTMASFNFDGSRILSASMDSTAKVWNLNKRDLQMDTTDMNFSIVKAELEAYPINIARTAIDEIRYSTIDSVLKNIVPSSFPIHEMYITGPNADEFKITGQNAPYRIDSNEIRGLDLSFEPKVIGSRTAVLNVVIPYDTVEIPINGEGYEAGIQLMVSAVDFGKVELGDFKDTVVAAVIKNRTSGKVMINSVANVGPEHEAFDILTEINDVTLDAWQTMPITLRFYAREIGRQQGVLQFNYDFTGSPAMLSLYAEAVEPIINKVVVSAPDRSAAPGEEFSLPINLSKTGEFNLKAKGIATELVFNPTMLEVLDKSLQIDYRNSKEAVLHLNMLSEFDSEEIYNLRFRAALGNDTISPLVFKNTAVIGNDKLEIETHDSRFTLTGICNEGGTRLIDTYSKLMLSGASPNPASVSAKIDFEIPASGRVKIYVTNIRGEVVLVAADGDFSKGQHSIDLNVSALSSGTYLYTLETSYSTESGRLDVVR